MKNKNKSKNNIKNKTNFDFIRYSNCWEDTEILLEGLDIKETEIGLSICSAGDNTLAMLIKNPKKVYAFDLNKTQIYCLELKKAAFKNLEYEEVLKFFGVRKDKNRVNTYKNIKNALSIDAKNYFDKNLCLIKKGIIHVGKFENFFRIFRNVIVPIVSTKANMKKFVQLDNLKKQETMYSEIINNKRFKFVFNIFFGDKVSGKLGRDKEFYKYVEEKSSTGKDLKKRFEYGIKNTINKTNSYFNYIILGNYNKDCMPLYLRKENFEKIKNTLDKIEIINGKLTDIKGLSEKIDFLNLSDIFEYMSMEEFNENINYLKKITRKGSRIVYWNMQNKRYIKDKKIILDKEKSKRLYVKNNSWFYRDFLIYKVGDIDD